MKAFYLATILAACALLSGRAGFCGFGEGLRWPADLEAAQAEAKEDSRWLAVFFSQPQSVSSRRMEKKTIPFAENQGILDKFVKVGLDIERNKDIADECGVSAGPAILFFDSQGNELDRFTGFVTARNFIAWTAAISPETSYSKAKAGLKDNPRDPESNYQMGCKYLHRRGAKQAWRYFSNCEQFDPEDKAGFADNIQLRRIEDQLQQGKIENAAKALEAFSAKWPESDETDRVEYLKARTLWLVGRTQVSAKAFRDFIEAYPKSTSRYLAEHALEGLASIPDSRVEKAPQARRYKVQGAVSETSEALGKR